MSQDGKNYLGSTLDSRDLAIESTILSYSKEEAINNRNFVNKIFNPKLGEGYLVYKDDLNERKIKCIVSKMPYFAKGNNYCSQSFLISLIANNPFYLDMEEIKKELVSWISNLSFSIDGSEGFEIIDGGIELGYREQNLIVNILNNGDVPTGIVLEFKAIAAVSKPKLLNVNTNEYIMIDKDMTAGEVITITTEFGHKTVNTIANGLSANIINDIDLGSTFLQLTPGDNIFNYSAASGLNSLNVTIYYTPKYLGV